jgi:hypothetical protein
MERKHDSCRGFCSIAAMTRAAVACGMAALVVLAAGCKSAPTTAAPATTATTVPLTTTGPGPAGPSPFLLTRRQVEAERPATPQKALLAWWRAAQFGDYRAYLRSFAGTLRRKLAAKPTETKAALVQFGGAIAVAKPKIVSVEKTGDTRTLYTDIAYHGRTKNGWVVVQSVPRSFTFAREGGVWRLLDDDFVQQNLPPALRHR